MSEQNPRDQKKIAYPVFRGLESLGIGESEIASELAVPERLVHDWRTGCQPVSGSRLSFLTRLLERLITQRATVAAYGEVMDYPTFGRLTRARDGLCQQQAFNRVLSELQQREGARLFAAWERRRLAVSADFHAVGESRAAAAV